MPEPTRREFALALALAPAVAVAADPPKAELSPADVAEALVRQRYGKILTDEQVAAARQDVLRDRLTAAALRRVKLTERDVPAVVFRAE